MLAMQAGRLEFGPPAPTGMEGRNVGSPLTPVFRRWRLVMPRAEWSTRIDKPVSSGFK